TVDDAGYLVPAMWNFTLYGTNFYSRTAQELWKYVRDNRILRPFYAAASTLGIPHTGDWTHLAVRGAPEFHHWVRSPGQHAAAKLADFDTVSTALDAYSPALIDEALRLLRPGKLGYAEKFIAPLTWLRALYDRPSGERGKNLRWRAVATAPDGYCHIRSAVTGTLLDSIKAGMPFDAIQRSFNEKVKAERYQRPTAPPSAGNIARGEKLVEQLGIARSLERRFARLDEIKTIWKPAPPAAEERQANGVFSHLKPKEPAQASVAVATQPVIMTWAKFEATVMPTAEHMQFLPPGMSNRFCAYLTAQHMDAPPIIKWDRPHRRNPVSFYVYTTAVPARQFRLWSGVWTDVMAISRRPNLWHDDTFAHIGDSGVLLVLNAAYDTRDDVGNALFPDILVHELHEVRATIEAYSRTAKIGGGDETAQLASGYHVGKLGSEGLIRAWAGGRYTDYKIDRWD